jgi:hypothetical protein
MSNNKTCFVIMGFGEKTDYESGRLLDLDATYEAIIKPAVEKAGLKCIRANEILHSGIIDTQMYKMLYQAELVIADISTGNINAVYELGVRHALCPNSTILMKEDEGKFSFDLDHVSTFEYSHLGKDIGYKEANRAREALSLLIGQAVVSTDPDSPVYTFLPRLSRPVLSKEEFDEIADEMKEEQERLHDFMSNGSLALKDSRPIDAVAAFKEASRIKPDDIYIIQQLSLATYKSEEPTKLDSLNIALGLMSGLQPDKSNDPETCGITGAINKRLWKETDDRLYLDAAIKFYGRGFEIRRDYYNGENLATCLNLRADIQTEASEITYDRMRASKVRIEVIKEIDAILFQDSFEDRSEKKWIYATYANCQYALGKNEFGKQYEDLFISQDPADWEIETFNEGKVVALAAKLK